MHTGSLNMLHHSRYQHLLAIADGIHINFNSIVEEAIEQQGLTLSNLNPLS